MSVEELHPLACHLKMVPPREKQHRGKQSHDSGEGRGLVMQFRYLASEISTSGLRACVCACACDIPSLVFRSQTEFFTLILASVLISLWPPSKSVRPPRSLWTGNL